MYPILAILFIGKFFFINFVIAAVLVISLNLGPTVLTIYTYHSGLCGCSACPEEQIQIVIHTFLAMKKMNCCNNFYRSTKDLPLFVER